MTFARVHEVTDKQAEAYAYLVQFISENGYQPSFTEMGDHFGVTRRAIADRFDQLAGKGYVTLSPTYHDRCVRLNHVRFVPEFITSKKAEDVNEKAAGVYAHLVHHVADNGFQPTWYETGESLGVTRKTVTEYLRQLAESGYLTLPPPSHDRCIRLHHVRFLPELKQE